MKTIYFPQTVVQEAFLADLESCFSSVEILQPCRMEIPGTMSRYLAAGFLTVRAVMADQEHRLVEAWKAFQSFARTHGSKGDLKTRFFTYMGGSGTPHEEAVASQIATIIKKGDKAGPTRQKIDPTFRAALFLYMAQQYDIQSFEVQEELISFTRTEKILVQSLSGEPPSGPEVAPFDPDPPGDHMASERLGAWARLFFNSPDPASLGKQVVWVTHSKPAVELLMEHTPSRYQTVRLDAFPSTNDRIDDRGSWKATFQESLARAVEDPEFCILDPLAAGSNPFNGPRALSITVYAVHENPEAFFGRTPQLSIFREFMDVPEKRTLVVLLSP